MLPRPSRSFWTLLASLFWAGSALGQSDGSLYTGHAIPGFWGMESSVRPPRGLSYENLAVFYAASREKDRNGVTKTGSGEVKHLSNHTTVTWRSPWRILGGTHVARLRMTLVSNAQNPRSLAASNDSGSLGDTYLEPLALYWEGEHGTVHFRYGIWQDTGSFSADSATNVGKGFSSSQATLGTTQYLDEERSLHYSLLVRYSTHSKVSGLNLRPGDEVILDWNIGTNLNERLSMGIGGYGVFQTSRDHGGDANEEIGFYGVGGIGFMGRYTLPDWTGNAYFRLFQELNAYNHTEGILAVVGVDFRL
jgi:hypothetical protein